MSTSAIVETYFDPEDDLEGRVAEEIGRAKRSVWIQAYKLSSERIADAILRMMRENPGLEVRLALDPKEAAARREKKQGRLVAAIAESGGEVRLVADADKSHSKFIIIDADVVLTGSFNFKRHADRVQRDNMVVIRSSDVAQTYAATFQATLTSEQARTATRHADAPRSAPRDGAMPDSSAVSPAGHHPPKVGPEPGGTTAETAAAAPISWLRWGSWLLESGQTLMLGFSFVLLAGLGLGLVAMMAFAEVADGVLDRETALFDRGIQVWISSLRRAELDGFAQAVSFMGGEGIWILLTLMLGLLARQRRFGAAGGLILVVVGAHLLNSALKVLYQRDRPTAILTDLPGQVWSFPSGHAMGGLAFYGFLAYLAWRLLRGPWRLVMVTVLVTTVGLVGLSRVYLDVHYMTDVLGGYLAGFIWLDAVLIGSHVLPRLGTLRGAAMRATVRPDASPPFGSGTNAGAAFAGMPWLLSAGTAALVLLLGTIGIERFEQVLEADAELEFSGMVEALPPAGLVGTWQIGGREVQVTETTEIERTSGLPVIGTLVSVEGTLLADRSISAIEIELGDDED